MTSPQASMPVKVKNLYPSCSPGILLRIKWDGWHRRQHFQTTQCCHKEEHHCHTAMTGDNCWEFWPSCIYSTFITAPSCHFEGLLLTPWILSWRDGEPKRTLCTIQAIGVPGNSFSQILLLMARRWPSDLRLNNQVLPPWNVNLEQNERESRNNQCSLQQWGLNCLTIPARRHFLGS